MNKYIIAFIGKAGSGKDTAASILDYLNNTPEQYQSYNDWHNNWKKVELDNIIHFAKNVKKIISLLYGIPMMYINKREYKDNKLFNLKNNKFVTEEIKEDLSEISINDLKKQHLKNCITEITLCNRIPVIKIRTMLQYFATDICRNLLDDKIWINSTLMNILNLNKDYNIIYVADCRFKNELNALKSLDDYKCISVKIIRTDNKYKVTEHESENCNYIDTDITLNLDSKISLEDFYNICVGLNKDINKLCNL